MVKKILLMVVMFTLVIVTPASADIAPPAEPPGANPVPGNEQTEVRMVEETVRIDIQTETPENSLGQALVKAEFIMRNLGNKDESMAVRFPLGIPNGWGDVALIEKISVVVDGKKVSTRIVNGLDAAGSSEEVHWAEFDAVFPAGKDVVVLVEYMLEGAGELPYIWLNYVFSSGAGWKDTIGSAELIVSFPYEVNELFLMNCIDNLYNCTVPGGVVEGNKITWTYTEFEPAAEDNFMIAFVAPSVWKQVLKEEERVSAAPNDGEAWGRLGRLYKSLIFSPHGWRGFRNYYYLADPGVEQLFQLADGAYTKAVTLLPEDALWHVGYGELLGYYADFAGYEGVDTLPLKIKALQEVHRALELAPDDEKVKEIAYGLTWPLEGGLVEENDSFNFPWLTATPVPTPTQLVIIEPSPTSTPVATTPPQVTPELAATDTVTVLTEVATIEPTPVNDDKGGIQICGAAILLPLFLMFGVKMGHNRSRKPSP